MVGGEVSPFRLVRLSAEELLSKEISEWKKPDAAEVNVTSLLLTHRTRVTFRSRELAALQDVLCCFSVIGCPPPQGQSPGARAHSGHSKLGNRHDAGPHSMDMEDAPPTSDTDVCNSAATSASRMASAAVSGGMLSSFNFHTLFLFAN